MKMEIPEQCKGCNCFDFEDTMCRCMTMYNVETGRLGLFPNDKNRWNCPEYPKDKNEKEVRAMAHNKKTIAGLNDYALSVSGYDKEKILEAVDKCIIVMSQLTIAESKVARTHLDNVMENMYKRSPDTLIGTIPTH